MDEEHKSKSDTKDSILTYIHMSAYMCAKGQKKTFKEK